MLPFRKTLRAWAPALLWMLAIYIGSTDVLSSQHTSRFLGPLLRWLVPGISDDGVRAAQFLVRKCGHLTEYALLAALFCRALSLTLRPIATLWTWRTAAGAFALAAAYAITDEIHQGLVASRYGSGLDVLIDSVGAALGLGAIWFWQTYHSRRERSRQADCAAEPAALCRAGK
jgi:VanZ family protein